MAADKNVKKKRRRGAGRPPIKPSPWEPPLNVSPEALAQAVLRSPEPEDRKSE